MAAVGITLFLSLFAAQAGVIALTPVLAKVADDLDVSTAAAASCAHRVRPGPRAWRRSRSARSPAGSAPSRDRRRRSGLAAASALSAAAPTFAVLVLAQVLLGSPSPASWSAARSPPPSGFRKSIAPGCLSWALVGPPAAWIVGMPLIGAIGEFSWRWTWLGTSSARRRRRRRHCGCAAAGVAAAPRHESQTTALRDRPTALWALAELLATSAWVGTLVFSGALFTETYGTPRSSPASCSRPAPQLYVAGNVMFRR